MSALHSTFSRSSLRSSLLDDDLDQAVLYFYFITFDRAVFFSEAVAGADVEAPAMQVAFDLVAVDA